MVSNIVHQVARASVRPYRRFQATRTLREMTMHSNPSIAALGESIRDGVLGKFSPIERAWMNRIEDHRAELMKNHDEIEFVDFGAGSAAARDLTSRTDEKSTTTLTVSSMCKASRPPFWGGILFRLVRDLKPVSCIEMGTCLGISGAYQAAALRINGKGWLHTLEGSPEVAKLAEETFEQLGIENTVVVSGSFRHTLGDVLCATEPVDYVFNDGHHDRDAVLEYFEKSLPFLANRAVLVFDDISWSAGMREAWERIRSDERVCVSVDLRLLGIVLVGDFGLKDKVNYNAPL